MARHIPPLLVALLVGCATGALGGTADPDEMTRSGAYVPREGAFVNQPTPARGLKLAELGGVIRRYRENEQRPPGPLPIASSADAAAAAERDVHVTWVGHSTVLIELDGFRVLTDPVWSDRVSPVPSIGPRRFHPPGIAWEDLPPIDAVIISHDHYDHLDHDTIQGLAWRGPKFFVPLGVGAHLRRWGVRDVYELDWWESVQLRRGSRTLELVATPAQHFSGRGMFDRNETLWASWVVRSESGAVYFGGDTGYFAGFAEIGARYGPFVATLLPIGAYDPAWADIHLNPEEAVQAHLDLGGAGMFVPIHYATFPLAAHGWSEPMERLTAAIDAREVKSYALPIVGQTVRTSSRVVHQTWWRAMSP